MSPLVSRGTALGLPLLATLLPFAAQAQSYRLTYVFNGMAANEMLTTSGPADANGFYNVSGLSGTFGGAVVSLLPPGTLGDNNNLFKPTPGYFDFYGIAFRASGTVWNLYTVSDGRQFQCTGEPDCQGGAVSNFTVTPAAAAVPEATSWAMMLAGFGAIGSAMRRRHKVAVSYAV